MFTEEIEIMKLLSEKYPDDIRIFFKSPKNIDEIISFEKETGIRLPDDIKKLYNLTNGFDSNIAYMNLWSLETIKRHFNEGYNDWIEEGDSDKYIVLGSDGSCGYLLMEIATGNYLSYGDEGEVMPIDSIKDLLCWNIDHIYDSVRDFEGDDKVNNYLERNADRI
ncbi:SMI1/KNR4 family protein [Ruminococcus flavefaciens]|uniref:SMI1/KNR4 family protein n=1 Tax=Ruminococcus flavefaciens TaxID=1265 RepID=UPI0013D8EC7D|nr:SMI1/KNR4 family protein [Ruminococcus flavefaciens]